MDWEGLKCGPRGLRRFPRRSLAPWDFTELISVVIDAVVRRIAGGILRPWHRKVVEATLVRDACHGSRRRVENVSKAFNLPRTAPVLRRSTAKRFVRCLMLQLVSFLSFLFTENFGVEATYTS